MTKKKLSRNNTVPAERQLRKIEGGVNAIRSDVRELRVSLAPLIPHIGAIEDELHDVRSSLDRIERAAVQPKRRASGSRTTR